MIAHPLEITFLIAALLALCGAVLLFVMKAGDIIKARRSKTNGPVLFMVLDNLRRQGFTLAVCGGMVMLAVSSMNNPIPLNSQTKNLLVGGVFFAAAILIEGVFVYRRREKLALMITAYEAAHLGIPGGKRSTDPPADSGEIP